MKVFKNFSKFLLWALYPSMVIHHEQCVFVIYDTSGRKRNSSQQLSKLIELKFISTTSRHQLTLVNKCIQQQITKCPKSILIALKTSNFTYIQLPVHHEIIVECKLVLKVLSFQIFSTWIKHKIVDINIQCTGFPMGSKLHFLQWEIYFSHFSVNS